MAAAFHTAGTEQLEVSRLADALRVFEEYTQSGAFLHIPFTTVFEYLKVGSLLRGVAINVRGCLHNAVLALCECFLVL